MTDKSKTNATLEPTVYLCAWDTRQSVPPGSHYGPVVRNIYTLECNVSGYGTVTINNKTFDVKPGDFYFLLPGQTVTFTADRHDPRIALYCTAGGVTEEELEDFCFELPRYKRPRKIIFADVPRNPTGKIEKPKLRRIYCGDSVVAQQNEIN